MVVSVEHRLIAAGVPLPAAVDDGWDVYRHVMGNAAQWGVAPGRAAVMRESAGALIVALAAIRARDTGVPLRAQVLVNPCTDVTPNALDVPSMIRYADAPMCTRQQTEFFLRLAVPPGTDPLPLSPLRTDDLTGLAPALVVVPTVDPLADHGRRYAGRLRDAGTAARLIEYPGATHAFLSLPGLAPMAKTARSDILGYLRETLTA